MHKVNHNLPAIDPESVDSLVVALTATCLEFQQMRGASLRTSLEIVEGVCELVAFQRNKATPSEWRNHFDARLAEHLDGTS